MASPGLAQVPLLQGLERCPGSVAGIELQQQVGNVIFHGPLRQRQQIGDLLIAVAGADQMQHFLFPNGERLGDFIVG